MQRGATQADLEQMLDLAEAKRKQYEGYQPRFHRPAAGAREAQRPYFSSLIEDENAIVLVFESAGRVDGFIIGQVFPAPPVYDPGGLSGLVDDFAVRDPELWQTVGRELLDAMRARMRERGAVQVIVVCGPQDRPKREMLTAAGLSVASEWLVGEI